MTIAWSDGYLLAIRSKNVTVFSVMLPDTPPRLLGCFKFPYGIRIFEVVHLKSSTVRPSTSGSSTTIFTLVGFLREGVYEITVTVKADPEAQPLTDISIGTGVPTPTWWLDSDMSHAEHPWHTLRQGPNDRRISWISYLLLEDPDNPEPFPGPRIVSAAFRFPSESQNPDLPGHEYLWDPSAMPALWAYPQFDFDDCTGLVVAGNIFGELALVDYVGLGGPEVWHVFENIVRNRDACAGYDASKVGRNLIFLSRSTQFNCSVSMSGAHRSAPPRLGFRGSSKRSFYFAYVYSTFKLGTRSLAYGRVV